MNKKIKEIDFKNCIAKIKLKKKKNPYMSLGEQYDFVSDYIHINVYIALVIYINT